MPVTARKMSHFLRSRLPQIDTRARFKKNKQIKAVINPRKKKISKVCSWSNSLIIDCIRDRQKVASSIRRTPFVIDLEIAVEWIQQWALILYKAKKNSCSLLRKWTDLREKKKAGCSPWKLVLFFVLFFVLLDINLSNGKQTCFLELVG